MPIRGTYETDNHADDHWPYATYMNNDEWHRRMLTLPTAKPIIHAACSKQVDWVENRRLLNHNMSKRNA